MAMRSHGRSERKVRYTSRNVFVRPSIGKKSSTAAATNTGRGYISTSSPALSTPFEIMSVQVLLGITVRILENAVVNAHGQGSDVAGDRRDFDARFEGSDVYRLKAAPLVPVMLMRSGSTSGASADNRRRAIRPRFPSAPGLCPPDKPDCPARMLSTDQVVAALASFASQNWLRSPWPTGSQAEDHISALHQSLAQRLIVCSCRSRRVRQERERQDTFWFCLTSRSIRHVQQGSHINAGKAFENQLLDVEAIHWNRAGDARVQWSSSRWASPPIILTSFCSQLTLQAQQIRFGANVCATPHSLLILRHAISV